MPPAVRHQLTRPSAYSNSLSYASDDVTNSASSPRILKDITVPSNVEFSIFSDTPCSANDAECGYFRNGTVAYRKVSPSPCHAQSLYTRANIFCRWVRRRLQNLPVRIQHAARCHRYWFECGHALHMDAQCSNPAYLTIYKLLLLSIWVRRVRSLRGSPF